MTKNDLIDAVSRKAGLTRAEADRAIAATLEVMTEALLGGDKVTLVGFGVLRPSIRAARTIRNPSTGEPMRLPTSNTVKFSVSKKLLERLNS